VYSTCLFCHAALGANEVVEAFPVGRRLAFDGERGRLWVICPRCARWNLTPVEERWEAIETCERLFRDTRLRTSTDQIGLARVAEGTELVRIGQPLRPELAAWRYGDQFGRRRRRAALAAGAGVGAAGLALLGGPLLGIGFGGAAAAVTAAWNAIAIRRALRRGIRVHDATGLPIIVDAHEIRHLALGVSADGDGWSLHVHHRNGEAIMEGRPALLAAAVLLPALNPLGGPRSDVREAVAFVDDSGSVDRVFTRTAHSGRRREGGFGTPITDARFVYALPTTVQLALEMAAHEEQERLALEGELAELERAWRDAEEIAAIADDLLLPDGVTDFLGRHRAPPAGELP
jgi:hypothetical protein